MRVLARITLLAMSLLALPACTSMLLGGGSSREPVATENRSSTQLASDNAISGSIRRQFAADTEISQYAIGIRTTSGRVTLSGTVGSYPIRDRVEQIARDTNGVRTVDSRIVVNTNL